MKKVFLSMVFIFSLYILGHCQSTSILFDKNSYTINQQAKIKLDSIIGVLKKVNVQEQLCLVGHTDSDADDVYNKQLSLNRAIAIRDYFLSNGILNTIHIESKGETKPITANTNDFEKSLNRRVEIIQNYKLENPIFTNYVKVAQLFKINPTRDTIIICQQGTKIKIDHWIFENADNSIPVTILVQEYLTKSDFIIANLTTTHSDGRIIESRGMIYIEAYQNNKPLTIKEGKSIDILFKDRALNDSTELFIGTRVNANIVWNQDRVNRSNMHDINGFSSSYSTAKRENSSKKKRRRKKKKDFTTNYAIYNRSLFDTINGVPCKIVQTYAKQKYSTDTIYITSDSIVKKEYENLLAERQFEKDMDLLMLSSPKLGWINCDRFYNNDAPRIDVIVEYQENYIPSFVLVFKNINAVLPYSYRIDNKIIFKNVPANEAFDIIGMHTNTKQTEFFLAQKPAKAISGNIGVVTFKKMDMQEFFSKIKNLN